MRTPVFSCCCSPSATPPRARVAAGEDGLLLDRVWAGHSVPFALLVERGYQFIAYYDAERRIVAPVAFSSTANPSPFSRNFRPLRR